MEKIRVLFLAASPTVAPLKLDEEIREITAKIRMADFRDSLEVISKWAVRPDDLQQALLEHRPHVLHFSGHGTKSEELVLLDDQGAPKPVSNAALTNLLRVLKDNLRLVVLNACFSRPQAEAIAQVVDCAVGMNQAVGDEAAIKFAAAFYRAIGFGRSIQTAFELGKSALMLDGIPEELTPALVVRTGVNPASIALIDEKRPSSSSALPQLPSLPPQVATPSAAATSISVEPPLVRLIRVFVSSPGDVAEERDVVSDVVGLINRTDGDERGVRLEALRWELDIARQIGPGAQAVVDGQLPAYHVYLGIMSGRLGTPFDQFQSGTQKEFLDALARFEKHGSPWIVFYFNDNPIPPKGTEATKQYLKVQEFRESLEPLGLIGSYRKATGTGDSFQNQLHRDLRKIVQTFQPLIRPGKHPLRRSAADPTFYLRELRDATANIELRGFVSRGVHAHQFPIEELYMTLTTAHGSELLDPHHEMTRTVGRNRPLHEALVEPRLVVVGDPGAGKTTFLRRVAHLLCRTELREELGAARQRLGLVDKTFPVFARLSEWDKHLQKHAGAEDSPAEDDSPLWLPRFLGELSHSSLTGLDAAFFREKLEQGLCTVLLDGLDESSDQSARERLIKLIQRSAKVYKNCRFVVTSRPAAYTGEVVLEGFSQARIDPLSDDAVTTFVDRWCGKLYPDNDKAAHEHFGQLLEAIREVAEIREMARNPVMLTAFAVVHWNQKRLPEQRAELYEAILGWLLKAREQRPGREKSEKTAFLLQELALAMQEHEQGMRTQVSKRWAAEQLAVHFLPSDPQRDSSGQSPKITTQSIRDAEAFLSDEEVDSGIVVGRGTDITFWHRTFQEYLASRAIAARPDDDQRQRLWGPPIRVFVPEWREVLLLLAGNLHRQGDAGFRVDRLVGEILKRLPADATLADQARCVGLLGAIERDLSPVGYKINSPDYVALALQVTAIFDRDRAAAIPLNVRIEAADALGQVGDLRIDLRRDDYWVTIPGDSFLMGAQRDNLQQPNYDTRAQHDEPVHRVELNEFQIAKYPVTVGQYKKFIEQDGYRENRFWNSGGWGEFTEPKDWDRQQAFATRPVVGVSWYEAMAFCVWAKCQLPCEAEWERAARGNRSRIFPWDGPANKLSERMNYSKTNVGYPTPVGIFPRGATPEGICDMAGNVWEWCRDAWRIDYGSEAAETETAEPGVGVLRVLRGGSWLYPAEYCRSAFRYWIEPAYRNVYLGFRVARSPSGQ